MSLKLNKDLESHNAAVIDPAVQTKQTGRKQPFGYMQRVIVLNFKNSKDKSRQHVHQTLCRNIVLSIKDKL